MQDELAAEMQEAAVAARVRDAVGDQLKLRIDPNTGYAPEVCEQLAKDLEPYNLEYLEQPMPDEHIGVAIFAVAFLLMEKIAPFSLNEPYAIN